MVSGPRTAGAILPLTAQATSDSSGNISFTFAQVAPGTVQQGTVSIPLAPLAAHWVATVAGVPVGAFDGYNPWGSIQIPAGQELVITGVGLAKNTGYLASWMAAQYPEGAAPVPPVPYGSITNVANIFNLPTPPATLVYADTLTIAATSTPVAFPPGVFTVGMIILALPPNANDIGITDVGFSPPNVFLLPPGYGIAIPISTPENLTYEGTMGDMLTVLGA